MANSKFVGIQVSPISFIDEGIDNVLDTLQGRVGVNVLMIGTVSWLGLKAGRSISYKLDGWPDHGVGEPIDMKGGAMLILTTSIRRSRSSARRTKSRAALTCWRRSFRPPTHGACA